MDAGFAGQLIDAILSERFAGKDMVLETRGYRLWKARAGKPDPRKAELPSTIQPPHYLPRPFRFRAVAAAHFSRCRQGDEEAQEVA